MDEYVYKGTINFH